MCIRDRLTTGERCIAGRCRRECFSDRDCRNDFWCDEGRCTPPPRLARDAGTTFDAPTDVPEDVSAEDAPTDTLCTGGPLRNVVAIASYGRHTCALVDVAGALSVYCWGEAFEAVGTTSVPTCASPIDGLDGLAIDAVNTSGGASCVRTTTGEVHCWGLNGDGALGRGPAAPAADPVPTLIPAFDADRVVGGLLHLCAERDGGVIACWGRNSAGQLGDGTLMARSSPVAAMTPGRGLALGVQHTCAIGVGGFPECWGLATLGRLGTGLATALPGARALSANNEHTCALDSASGVQCWGANASGQLGRGMISLSESAPVPVAGLPGAATAITTGYDHSCALVGTDAWCWGGAGIWQDGLDPELAPRRRLSGVSAIASGAVHVCGISSDGTGRVLCVGQGSAGELGVGSHLNSADPVTVLAR